MSTLKTAHLREHAFNSRWWGERVGIIDCADFFEQARSERRRQLQPWAWVEFQADLGASLDRQKLLEDGFFMVDTQLRFRLALEKVRADSRDRCLEVHTALARPDLFANRQVASFRHERFMTLPGATQKIVDRRYALWAEELICEHSATCLAITHDDEVRGWFLGRPRNDSSIELTLAMTARDQSLSGYALYLAAIKSYARSGWRLGEAGFSAANIAVHNIYAALGARFLTPTQHWFCVPRRHARLR